MKPISIFSVLALVVVALSLSMCSEKDDKTEAPAPILPTDIVPKLVQDTWRVTFYERAGTDLTAGLSPYTFLYDSEGKVTATETTATEGTWSAGTESGKTLLKLNLKQEDVVTVLDSISKDWVITSVAEDKLEMTFTNADQTTNQLTFEKN